MFRMYIKMNGQDAVYKDLGTSRESAFYRFQSIITSEAAFFNRHYNVTGRREKRVYMLAELVSDTVSGGYFVHEILQVELRGRF